MTAVPPIPDRIDNAPMVCLDRVAAAQTVPVLGKCRFLENEWGRP